MRCGDGGNDIFNLAVVISWICMDMDEAADRRKCKSEVTPRAYQDILNDVCNLNF